MVVGKVRAKARGEKMPLMSRRGGREAVGRVECVTRL